MPMRQTVTITVTTKDDAGTSPRRVLIEALDHDERVLSRGVVPGTTSEVETIPGVNRQRLIELAVWAAGEHAKQELGLPSEWNQRAWLTRWKQVNSCGTACCTAGKVALDDGGVPCGWGGADWEALEDGAESTAVRLPDGAVVEVRKYARDALGLSEDQAIRLFRGLNRLSDVLRVIGDLLRESAA